MADYEEIEAMKKIADALESLDDAARQRALHWALSRYRGSKPSEGMAQSAISSGAGGESRTDAATFDSFAELFEATNPTMEREKALVAGYWIQVCEENAGGFPSQTLNGRLKDLGHGIGNITEALTQLKTERPALVLQLKKSGTTQQARKTYKLTQEGIKRVQTMVRDQAASRETT
jgi:hypothetical protein